MKVMQNLNWKNQILNKLQIRVDFIGSFSKDVFGRIERQESCTSYLSYKSAVKHKKNENVVSPLFAPGKAIGFAQANIEVGHEAGKTSSNFNDFTWYVPKYTPKIPQEAIISKHMISRVPRNYHVEKSVQTKMSK